VVWTMPLQQRFADRREAGRALAQRLTAYRGQPDVIVLALPRGGVPVAYEVAHAIGAPLDVFVVRKLGLPGHREYAIGALASGGVRIVNTDLVQWYGVPEAAIDAVVREEEAELRRREWEYRGDLPPLDLGKRTVILIDDGLATGSTMKAAVEAVRARGPSRIVVGVPVGAPESCEEFSRLADEVVCARTPEPFRAVGLWYADFSETSDDEVQRLLHAGRELPARR
jgi:putative phosphoribosyl transferase